MILFKVIMDAKIKVKGDICPYRKKDTNHTRVFNYKGRGLYCDNAECSNLDQSKAFYVEVGEGAPVGICRTDGFVNETSGLIKSIEESGFFKTLEAEKSKEESRNREEVIRAELFS